MSKQIEEALRNAGMIYYQAVKDLINHPDDDEYAERESRAYTLLYNAIKDDVLERHAQDILDELHGVLPF